MSSSSSPSSLVFPSILSSFFVSLLSLLFLSSPFLLSATRDTNHRRCIHEQSTALLDLKRGFEFDPSDSSTNLSSWNFDGDCCSWEGITCNTSTGHVIGLDLSSLYIYGLFDFQSLFRLRSLQRLDLSYNAFDGSPIPSGFHQLASLTHLNLSGCSFYGQIPLDFSRLTRLVSLDLSYNEYIPEGCNFESDDCGIPLSLKNLGMRGLLQNLSNLGELYLDWVDLSMQGRQWNEALSYAPPHLRKLSMVSCRLSGPIHPPPSPLRLITHIDLSGNNLCCPVPDFIANFTSLTHLKLYGCCLHSEFPKSIFNLPRIRTIDISRNPLLTGSLPEFSPNSSIQELSMWATAFYGKLPYSLGNLKSLTVLDISDCNLSGPVPQSFVKLSQIASLYLSNNCLSGPMPQSLMNFSQLAGIDLSHNMLNGPIPSALFSLPSLYYLDLSHNHFSGELCWSKNASSSPLYKIALNDNNLHGPVPGSLFELTTHHELLLSSNNFSSIHFRNLSSSLLGSLSLDRNNFHGPIPKMIFQLTWLERLNLSSNNFSGVIDLGLFHNHKNLSRLDLSDNSLTVIDSSMSFPQLTHLKLRSCSINKFPDVLRNQELIMDLDLSSNEINGKIPQWIWKVGNGDSVLNLSHNALERIEEPLYLITSSGWKVLDLSFNKLEGFIPIPPNSSRFFSISNNKFSGDVPSQICNAAILELMDLSNNNFSGRIPKCLGGMSDVLYVLKLRGNNFSRTLLQQFTDSCQLRTIDLNGNRLEGHLPKSLANCKMLEVLDLGNNRIYGAFPVWLKDLPQLRVLVLRSNQFQGTLGYRPTYRDFPQLQIFDISFNNFTGRLPFDIFKDWKAMMVRNKSETMYLGTPIQTDIYYEDTVTVVGKGYEMHLDRILTAFTLLDLSNNKFEGGIPMSVADLRSLHIINMSHNCFTGRIPAPLGDIRELESLDLSQNQLSGEIPWQLGKLSWLAVLNLSQNHLVGRIPPGPQFNTFTNESFQGNLGLCGLPLSKKCEEDAVSPPPPPTESESEYDWEFMWIGFGIGHGVGLGILIWTLALWRKGRIAFFTFADRMLSFIFPPAAFSCLQQCRGNRRRNRRPKLTT